MSDYSPHSPPDADPPNSGGLPTRRSEPVEPPESGGEAPQPVSLDEMMERLQRSGSSSASGSGRRRRRSSSSQGSSSSGSSSGQRSRSSSRQEDDRRYEAPAAVSSNLEDLPRAVLPPPRRREGEAPLPARRTFAEAKVQTSRRKWWLWAGGAVLLLGAGSWFGVRQLNRWRTEGEGFRVNVGRRLSELTKRPISTARFRQLGADQLGTATLTLRPDLKDLMASAEFSSITAQFAPGSALADDWTIQSLRFANGEITFQPEKPLDTTTMWAIPPAPVDAGAAPRSGFRLGMTPEPSRVTVEQGRFDQLSLSWPGPNLKPESLTNLSGNFRIIDQVIQMEIAGGLLDTAAWPPMLVRQMNAKLKGTALEIVSARLGLTAENEIRVTGSAQLVPDGRMDLKADFAPLLLKHLLPTLWASTTLGTFEAEGAVWQSQFKTGTPEASLSGPFRVKGFVMRGMPFVEKIANLLRKPDLALMEFPVLSGKFVWSPSGTRLTDLSATTGDGLFRLKGSAFTLPGESLTAEITVEANEAYFVGLPAETADLFTAGAEGWRSLTFTLGGIEGAVTDNIGTATPAIIRRLPQQQVIEMPRMQVPPGVVPPPQPQTPAPAAPPVAAPRPLPPPPGPPPASEEELERQFKALIGK